MKNTLRIKAQQVAEALATLVTEGTVVPDNFQDRFVVEDSRSNVLAYVYFRHYDNEVLLNPGITGLHNHYYPVLNVDIDVIVRAVDEVRNQFEACHEAFEKALTQLPPPPAVITIPACNYVNMPSQEYFEEVIAS